MLAQDAQWKSDHCLPVVSDGSASDWFAGCQRSNENVIYMQDLQDVCTLEISLGGSFFWFEDRGLQDFGMQQETVLVLRCLREGNGKMDEEERNQMLRNVICLLSAVRPTGVTRCPVREAFFVQEPFTWTSPTA